MQNEILTTKFLFNATKCSYWHYLINGFFIDPYTKMSNRKVTWLTMRLVLSQRGWASRREVGPLTERLGLLQRGWASHRKVGPRAERLGLFCREVGPLAERLGHLQRGWASHREVGPLTEWPWPLSEGPGPLRDRPRSFTQRSWPVKILLASESSFNLGWSVIMTSVCLQEEERTTCRNSAPTPVPSPWRTPGRSCLQAAVQAALLIYTGTCSGECSMSPSFPLSQVLRHPLPGLPARPEREEDIPRLWVLHQL